MNATPKFKRPTCKGSFALGTACGHCERCEWERTQTTIMPVQSTAPKVPPNRMKFASLVSKLDPLDLDYATQVCKLAEDMARRDRLIQALVKAYTEGEVEDKVYGLLGDTAEGSTAAGQLDDAIRAAIERFVVDRY